MNARRVVVVTRRFWPLVGESEIAAADIASALQEAGQQTSVLTASWHKNWPQQFRYEEIAIVRIAQPSLPIWGDWQYVRSVTRWLRAAQSEFDIALIFGLRHDALAALGALARTSTPVVLLADDEDLRWLESAHLGGHVRRRCRRADAIVVPDRATHNAFTSVGFDTQRLHVIEPGVPVIPSPSGELRRLARGALAKGWGGPHVGPLAPVALCISPLETNLGLLELFSAWKRVVAHWPDAQLWLIGEGTERAALYHHIEQLDMTGRVLMPGLAESFEDLFAAADVTVAPSAGGRASRFLLMAMSAGLPVVASNTLAHRTMVTNNECGLLFDPDEVEQLEAALTRLFKQPSLAASLGADARERVASRYSIGRHCEALCDLFDRLISAKSQRWR